MAHVAVTGAGGFIGSAVVRQLLAAKRDVRAILAPGEATTNLEGLEVERVTCDVLDLPRMRAVLSGCDALYHLAAVYKTWMPSPEPLFRVNVEGTTSTLLAAAEAKVRRVVYTSSVAAVGLAPGGEADETTRFNAFDVANEYILSKWLSERVALQFAASSLDLVVVNPSFPFGPRDIAPTPTGRIVLSVLKGEAPVWSPGGFNAIDVDDCAAGHLLAEEKGRRGERYILGNANVTVKEFFDLIAKVGGVKPPRLPVPKVVSAALGLGLELVAEHVTREEPRATYRAVRYMQKVAFFSNAKAKRELGLPTRPLEETVRRAVGWFRAQGLAP